MSRAKAPFKIIKTSSCWDIIGATDQAAENQYNFFDRNLTEQEAQIIVAALNNYYRGNEKCCRAKDIKYVD